VPPRPLCACTCTCACLQGAASVEHVVQPAYDARLQYILRHKDTVHLESVDAVLAFSAGVGVVWYDCPTHVFNHDHMRSVAAFFGLWHEGGRGGRDGVQVRGVF
jgi:hypothetical protein